jgi:hypothetical protein
VEAKRIWCQESGVEKLREYTGQYEKQRGVFFTYHESPVIGQDNCLWLWSKYVQGIAIENINGIQVCAAERWAYLPEDAEEHVTALVNITACHLDVTGEQLCIRACQIMRIWYNNYIARNQWGDVTKDSFWPTPVPPTR